MMSSDNSLDSLIKSDELKTTTTWIFMCQIIFPIIGGFMFGYDTGVISGALILLKEYFHLTTITQEITVCATIIAAAIGSLLGGVISNMFGRKKTMVISCINFIIGSILMGVSVNIVMLIIGRFIVGIGVGLSASSCPIYISEVSPEHIRGRLLLLYQMGITAGMFLASVVNASFNYIGTEGWRYMLGGAAVPSFIELIGMLAVPESYRWLISKNRVEEAKRIVEKQSMISGDMIDNHIQDIIDANQALELQMKEHKSRNKTLFCQIYNDKVARQSLLIGCGIQMLAQIIGINTIMYYTASVIRMSGFEKTSTILWLTALVTFFNFLPSLIGYFLIDKIGRRKLAMISILGVFLSLITLAITFQIFAANSSPVLWTAQPASLSDIVCSKKKTCDDCLISPSCGYCYIPSPVNKDVIINSTCLGTSDSFSRFSSSGWCAKNATVSNMKAYWLHDFCKFKYAWIIILGMILYLICFTIGMGPIPWIITSEIYPIWCRSTNMALSTATNWIFNLIISLTFLSLTEAITKYGTFWLYSSFAIIGFLFIYKFLPETNQKTLEEINLLIENSSI